MLFMAEEHPSISGKLGERSAESGSSGVIGVVYGAPLKQWGLVGWGSGLGQEGLCVEKLGTISMRLDCREPAGLARGVSGKVRW